MAMTLGQLVRSLSREIGGTIDSADDRNNQFQLTVPFNDGRSQQVFVFLGNDADNTEWFVVNSTFGSVGELDLHDLLQRNYTHYGFGSICSIDDSLRVIAQLPLSHVDVELGKQLILQTAIWADSLEEEFYGDDNA